MAYYSLDRKQFTTLELSVRIIEKKNYYKIFSTPKPYALIFSCNAEKLEEILQYNNSDTVLPPNSRLPNSRSLQIHGFVSISRKLLIHGFRSKILQIHGFVSISRKWTPIHAASAFGFLDIVELLVPLVTDGVLCAAI